VTPIKAGDPITLTWEGSNQREVDEVVAVQGGAVALKRHTPIRDDQPVWDDAAGHWAYCYGRFSGS
jgi:hypothetical protein